MSNNEMVSVPRKLLKDMHEHPDCPVEFIDHLRRSLDQPVPPAGDLQAELNALKAAQGEPIGEVVGFSDGEARVELYGVGLEYGTKLFTGAGVPRV